MISQCANAPGLCSRKVFAVYPYMQVLAIAVRQTMYVASHITPSRMVTELPSLTMWEHSRMRSWLEAECSLTVHIVLLCRWCGGFCPESWLGCSWKYYQTCIKCNISACLSSVSNSLSGGKMAEWWLVGANHSRPVWAEPWCGEVLLIQTKQLCLLGCHLKLSLT